MLDKSRHLSDLFFLICQDLEIELVYHSVSPAESGTMLCESFDNPLN